MSDQAATEPDATQPEPSPTELAFRMGLALGRIEGKLDGFLLALGKRLDAPAGTDRTE